MLKRIYVDNFRCLTNFEISPHQQNLLIGDNGSGKTTLFQLLDSLASMISGHSSLGEVFPKSSLTRWDGRKQQRFELELESETVRFSYGLVVEHPEERKEPLASQEWLKCDDSPLYQFENGHVKLFHDDSTLAASFPFNPSVPFLALVEERPTNRRLMRFKRQLQDLWYLSIEPARMRSESREESEGPETDGSNLVDWYRSIAQERPETLGPLFGDLKDLIGGFSSLTLVKTSEDTRALRCVMAVDGSEYTLGLSELSAGQRALLFYYLLLNTGIGPERILMIDEPDNFVALREIQPWLVELSERAEAKNCQLFLISHNSEVIDYLTEPPAWIFERLDGGPVRIRQSSNEGEDNLSRAELMARGWMNG